MSGLFERLTGLVLREPGWLLLAVLVLVALLVRRWGGRPALLFAPTALLTGAGGTTAPLPRSWRVRLRGVPRALQALGLLLCLVALARPAATEDVPVESEGLDILLVLDVSSSMTANDLDPTRSRLEVAKDAAAAFVAARPGDRIGLVAFARFPDVLCPPTRDHAALLEILRGVETVSGDGPEDATGIGTATARAAQVLGGERAGSAVVILLTDGEENVALVGTKDEIAPVQAAQLCARFGVTAHTIVAGLGRRDASGGWRPLDTRAVRDLAERTGGTYNEARDAGALDAVYRRIDELEKAPFAEPRTRLVDRYLAFLLAALGLLLAARLLEGTVWEVLP